MGHRGLTEHERPDEIHLEHPTKLCGRDPIEMLEQQDPRDVAKRVEASETL